MADIKSLDVISRGLDINPVATKILFAVPILAACLALVIALVKDPTSAVFGGVLTIIGAVIVLLVTAIPAGQAGALGIWLARYCLVLFCAATTVLFISACTEWPRPFGCVIRPMEACVTSLDRIAALPAAAPDGTTEALRKYLYPTGSVLSEGRAHELNDALRRIGAANLADPQAYARLLYLPEHAPVRQKIASLLDVEEKLRKKYN